MQEKADIQDPGQVGIRIPFLGSISPNEPGQEVETESEPEGLQAQRAQGNDSDA